jgi:hypothetical protein
MTPIKLYSIPHDIKPLVRRLIRQVNSLQFEEAINKADEIFRLLIKETPDTESELNKHYIFVR